MVVGLVFWQQELEISEVVSLNACRAQGSSSANDHCDQQKLPERPLHKFLSREPRGTREPSLRPPLTPSLACQHPGPPWHHLRLAWHPPGLANPPPHRQGSEAIGNQPPIPGDNNLVKMVLTNCLELGGYKTDFSLVNDTWWMLMKEYGVISAPRPEIFASITRL